MRVCGNCGERGVFRYQALICDRCFDEKLYEGNEDEEKFPKEELRLSRIFKISDETLSE